MKYLYLLPILLLGFASCKKDSSSPSPNQDLPTLSTDSVGQIRDSSAVVYTKISSDGGASLVLAGVVWGENQNPTITDHISSTSSFTVGSYNVRLTGLRPGTTYYARAFGTNAKGTQYGGSLQFRTMMSVQTPTVRTDSVGTIKDISALLYGTVTAEGSAAVTAAGFAYGTNPNPTTFDNYLAVTGGTGVGSYHVKALDLTPNTQYYARAYATNAKGTQYGTQIQFRTKAAAIYVSTDSVYHYMLGMGNYYRAYGTVYGTPNDEPVVSYGFIMITPSTGRTDTTYATGEKIEHRMLTPQAITSPIHFYDDRGPTFDTYFRAFVHTATKTYYGKNK